MSGDDPDDSLVSARRGLLDALAALGPHAEHVVLVGAQAIYIHTNDVVTGVALFTKDADVLLVPPVAAAPDIEQAMTEGGFQPGPQPGIWMDEGRQVDLLVPELLASNRGRRAARLDGHGASAARWVPGLEGAAVDNDIREVGSLDVSDRRTTLVRVAGPSALLVSKAFKLQERVDAGRPERIDAKDAFDAYRLLQLPSPVLARGFRRLMDDPMAGEVTATGVRHLRKLFANERAPGTVLTGQYVEGVGDPSVVRASVVQLVTDLMRDIA